MAIFEAVRFSRKGLWSLFLICAFPLHVWTLILAFRDFSWLAERTNTWDALGVVSYGLVFAFLESLLVTLVVALLGLLVPKSWEESRRIALLSSLALIAAFWAILGQLYFLLGVSLPERVIVSLAGSEHPLRILYLASMILVSPTVLLPAYLVLQSDKTLRFVTDMTERLSLLSTFYLFLDAAGLVIIVIRNL